MEAVEPVKFHVKGRGLDVKSDDDTIVVRDEPWDDTHKYIYNRIAEEYCEEVSRESLADRYRELIENAIKPVKAVLPELLEDLPLHEMSGFYPFYMNFYIHDEDTVVLPSTEHEGLICIISNNKNKAQTLRDNIVDKLKEASDTYAGLGVDEIEISTKEDFVIDILTTMDRVGNVEVGDLNEFEEHVLQELTPISESFLNNATVDFNGYPQNREFDILFGLSEDNLIHISVKDFSGLDENPTKDDLITDPASISSLIGANKTFSVVRGADSEILDDYEREAQLRDDISLCKDNKFKEDIKDYIQEDMIPVFVFGKRWRLA